MAETITDVVDSTKMDKAHADIVSQLGNSGVTLFKQNLIGNTKTIGFYSGEEAARQHNNCVYAYSFVDIRDSILYKANNPFFVEVPNSFRIGAKGRRLPGEIDSFLEKRVNELSIKTDTSGLFGYEPILTKNGKVYLRDARVTVTYAIPKSFNTRDTDSSPNDVIVTLLSYPEVIKRRFQLSDEEFIHEIVPVFNNLNDAGYPYVEDPHSIGIQTRGYVNRFLVPMLEARHGYMMEDLRRGGPSALDSI